MRTLHLISISFLLVAACSGGSSTYTAALLADTDTSQFVPITDAIARATAEVNGFVVGAQLELEDDDEQEPPAYEVTIFVSDTKQLMDVEIDAVTGEVLEVEVADGEDEGGENREEPGM